MLRRFILRRFLTGSDGQFALALLILWLFGLVTGFVMGKL